MAVLSQLLIALVPVLVVTTGTAIYLNRRKSDRLYQRLFGLADDPEDEGYIPEMNTKMESIDANVKDLNHRRIDDIEARLDTLSEQLTAVEERLQTEEDK